MIRLFDAAKLATTKLRTRKVRLVVTVVIAGLMFSALAAVSMVSRGAFDSLASFNREAFGERYIVAAYPQSGNGDFGRDPAVIKRAEAIHQDLVSRKTAEAKKLGIPYDPKSERPPVDEFDTPDGKQRSVSFEQPAGQQAIKEYLAAHPAPGQAQLRQLSSGYRPAAFYESKSLAFGPDMPTLKLLKDDKEPFEGSFGPGQDHGPGPQTGLGSFTTSWGLMSRDLFRPFVLPGATTAIGPDGSIPVVAPYSAVEQLIGLKALSSTAAPAERLERLKQVRAGAQQVSFEVCYRNKSSDQLLSQAIAIQQDITQNKDKKDYVRPDLVYDLPAKPCAAPAISRDVRTAAEKQQAAKQAQFDRAFGKADPQQTILKFRVIGIAPDPPGANASVLSTLVGFLVSSNLGLGAQSWYSPLELEKQQPLLASIFDNGSSPGAVNGQFVEFSDAGTAKTFIEQASCQPDFNFSAGRPDSPFDPFAGCAKQGKHFALIPFGSNSLALEDAKRGFAKIFTYAALSVAVIAAIIMVGTVGRIIADSRRETAVFRAIGAKKLDIVQIYVIYTFFLSLLIFGFALLLGLAVSQFVHGRFSPEFTVQALVAYNAQDLTRTFNLYGFYLPDMLRLLGLSLAGGALSAFFPLLRNLRRNPIGDMRDDT